MDSLIGSLPWWRPVLAVVCLIVVAAMLVCWIVSDLRRWSNGDF